MPIGTSLASYAARKFRSLKTVNPSWFLGGFFTETLRGTPALYNHYEEAYALTLTFPVQTGLNAQVTINALAYKNGKNVTIVIPADTVFATTATNANTFNATAFQASESRFLPKTSGATSQNVTVPAIDNATTTNFWITISSTGVLSMTKPGGNFTASSTVTLKATEIPYIAAN
jgi:hypothetical protein